MPVNTSKDTARILGYRLLQELSGKGTSKRAEEYVRAGANLQIRDSNGNTALHLAARYGNTLLVKLMLENGADPNVQNSHRTTVLHMAALGFGGVEMVALLIKHGANGGIKDQNGLTPLDIAERFGKKPEILDVLIKEQTRRFLIKGAEKSDTTWMNGLKKR